MAELYDLLPPAEALQIFREHLSPRVEPETLQVRTGLDRVLAQNLTAPSNLPAFPRSTMDGFAVQAADTYGASDGLPAYLTVVGEVPMGESPEVEVQEGQAAVVHTGGMIPPGADAVMMVEHTQEVDDATIEVMRPVAVGEHVIQVGEDVKEGELILPKGHLIRPQDIGGLLAQGITEIDVARRPRVAVLSSGDEVVPPEVEPEPGQVRDINTYTASALTQRAGGVPIPLGIAPDLYEELLASAKRGIENADMLVISAGSSVSVRDMTARAINELGEPGVLVHGVSLRPGKPTILALVDGKPAFGLPGNPVSAMIIFEVFVIPTIYALMGCDNPPARREVRAKLAHNISSEVGREDYIQVRLEQRDGDVWADPVFGKSNLIYTLIKADGVLQVPLNKRGLAEGETVSVKLF